MARRGSNPTKTGDELPPYGLVRIIIPVYIPSLDGYFTDSLRVFEAMLDSLMETTDDRVLVTVIDNACAPEVFKVLHGHLSDGRIDRLVHNGVNRGKIDPVLSELRSSHEPFLVVADADVAFRSGWLDAFLSAMSVFPECGLLSLHPTPEMRWHSSGSLLVSRLSGTRLRRARLVDQEDVERFAESVGRAAPEPPTEGDLLLVRGGSALVVGFGHFAFAIRKHAVRDLPSGPSRSTRKGVIIDYFEKPADRAGWWCASVPRALVHHIGNVLDAEEKRRIAAFTSTAFADTAESDIPGPSKSLSRYLPEVARRAATGVSARIERIPWLNRAIFRDANIELKLGSASQIEEAS